MRYYLIEDAKEERLVIGTLEDFSKRTGYVVKETTEARSWIEAKRNFGFPLTSCQEALLGTPLKKAA